jgi:hypothetical protein
MQRNHRWTAAAVIVAGAAGAWLGVRSCGPAGPSGPGQAVAAAPPAIRVVPGPDGAAPDALAGGARDARVAGRDAPVDLPVPLDAALAPDAPIGVPVPLAVDAGPGASAPARPAAPGTAAEPPEGGLVDRTGWNNGVGAQLNREFMPLATECVDLARARDPALHGNLIVQITVAPAEGKKVIVASVTPRADNEIVDPELLECIRESSFSLDGLDAPHGFDITMPIRPSR